jgi:hypothetical protein
MLEKTTQEFIKDLFFNKKQFTIENGYNLGNMISYIEYPDFLNGIKAGHFDFKTLNDGNGVYPQAIYEISEIFEDHDLAYVELINNPNCKIFTFAIDIDEADEIYFQNQIKIIN